tara:strand:+ start:67 stop:1101 length:1035 start_codon:yes stop_codon:yes gene_type:complete
MANLIRYNDTDVVNDTSRATTSTWTNNTNNLQVAHTSSTQAVFTTATSSGAHFIEIFNEPTSSTTAAVQYAIAYGHRKGSGSLDFTNDTGALGKSASSNIYSQYRQLVFGDETSNFTFNGFVPDDIYVININRSRYKHNLKPGTLDLRLSGSAGGARTIHLTDDSTTTTGSSTITNAGRQFNIVSGSLGTMSGSTLDQVSNTGSYGLFYPDSGFIILNPQALTDTSAIGLTSSVVAHTNAKNHETLKDHISRSGHFIVDSEEKVSSQYYFTRATNSEFNYTTNPSFIDNVGNLNFTSMIDNPTTFITTVGLYNDSGDLVAVAKLSQPVTKDFTKEALIRVKLDY